MKETKMPEVKWRNVEEIYPPDVLRNDLLNDLFYTPRRPTMGECFKLIAKRLDVAPLLNKLAERPELWTQNPTRQSYPGSAHKDTETIYLRWARDQSLQGAWFDLTSEDHIETISALAPDIFPLMQAVCGNILGPEAEAFNHHIGRVILTKLKPGGVISEHVDEGPYADRYDRFHVVLQSELGNIFIVSGEHYESRPGDVFWFNHKLPHQVENHTDEPRIHLILDVAAPEYRKLRGLTFQRERPHELLDEARPLFEAHYKEIAHYQDIPLDINDAAYCQLEESGLLRCFTARYNGELVGYCVFVVKRNPRYQTSLQANQDILYMDKSRRGALFGKRLLDYCHARLQAEGVQVVYQHTKAARSEGRFMELMGYELVDYIYAKRLDR
ncbi:MAG: GNAT family N-acetyltransferase [Burkholderiales bacterium]